MTFERFLQLKRDPRVTDLEYEPSRFGERLLKQLESSHAISGELVEYLAMICPKKTLQLEAAGNPLFVYPPEELNGMPWCSLPAWRPNWLLLATEDTFQFIVDLDKAQGERCQMLSAPYEYGKFLWDFELACESISDFLYLGTLRHLAVTETGPNLAPEWLITIVTEVAGDLAHIWLSGFDNWVQPQFRTS